MPEIKDDKYYLARMLHYSMLIEAYYKVLVQHGKNMTADDQESDGIIFEFNQLREEAKHISESYLRNHADLSEHITLLIRFRNKIIHDYDNVTYSFFDEIIANDIPKLIVILQNCLKEAM